MPEHLNHELKIGAVSRAGRSFGLFIKKNPEGPASNKVDVGKNRSHQKSLPLKATMVILKAMVRVGFTRPRNG